MTDLRGPTGQSAGLRPSRAAEDSAFVAMGDGQPTDKSEPSAQAILEKQCKISRQVMSELGATRLFVSSIKVRPIWLDACPLL